MCVARTQKKVILQKYILTCTDQYNMEFIKIRML